MTNPVLHPVTAEAIKRFVAAPSHALCLIGPPGAGKSYTAHYLAHSLLGEHTDDAVHAVGEDDMAIGIEQIRNLQQFLRLKKPGTAEVRRVIIIANAFRMSDEAQNALLKTLEEPPADTVFVLTTDGSASLRPTIYSRVQSVHILPLPEEQAKAAFSASTADFNKAYHLSGGYTGLLHALLNDTRHELVAAVEQAKKIIQSQPFERLLLVDGLAKQKDSLPTIFYALQRVVGALLARQSDTKQLRRLTGSMRAVYDAQRDFSLNANTKLLLTDLFLQL